MTCAMTWPQLSREPGSDRQRQKKRKTRRIPRIVRVGGHIGAEVLRHQQPQQTGMLLMSRQQVQPAFIIPAMQAQQASIMAQHAGSPLVQVMQTPSSVGSHLHRPIVKLQQQTIMPFNMQQQLQRPPAIMLQRF
jgi:hypothetical protein